MINQIKKLKKLQLPLASVIAGGLLCLGFSPYEYTSAAFIAPAILLWIIKEQKPKHALLLGYLFGLSTFGFGVSWIFHSIYYFGETSYWLSLILTSIFVSILATFFAGLCYCLNKFFNKEGPIRWFLAFPALWVLFDVLRGFIFTGFPWLYVGYAQINTIIRGFATIGGVWLVTLISIIISASIYACYYHMNSHQKSTLTRNIIISLLIIFWPIGYWLDDIKWTKALAPSVSVSIIQGNIPQELRWSDSHLHNIMKTYLGLTQSELGNNIIIWPEGAMPFPIPYNTPYANDFIKDLHNISLQHNSAMIIGIPEQSQNKEQYYNSLIAIGDGHGIYRKTQLVPFGEYVPFESLLRGVITFFNLPMSQFIPYSGIQQPLTAHGISFAPTICYEIAYPNLVRKSVKNNDVILTVSNDAWFGNTDGPKQHLQIAQLRALETGRYIIRSTNNGITAIIAPNGSIVSRIPQFEPGILVADIIPMTGNTLWVIIGPWPWYLFFISMLIVAWYIKKYTKNHY